MAALSLSRPMTEGSNTAATFPSSRPKLQRSDVMRLVNVGTMQLHYLPDTDIVDIEYATLSHTWGPYEATYQEWHNAQARESYAAKKIRDACQVVKESMGLQWLWADTCCINKADKGEVNEAVNSMFSWYRSSNVCLAYLSDVPTANTNDNELLWSQVRGSRWFTRGWTLPELLAPPQLIFYAADWTILGRRDDSLAELISEITGIDQTYLSRRKDLQQASVGEKMSWMSNRKTTRVEDMAYCMLGILGIEMDVHYGQGKRAMGRLQKRIEEKTSTKMDHLSDSAIHKTDMRHYTVAKGPLGTINKVTFVENSGGDTKQNLLLIWILDPYDEGAGTLKAILEKTDKTHVTIKDVDTLRIEYQTMPLVFYRARTPFVDHRVVRGRITSSGYVLCGFAQLIKTFTFPSSLSEYDIFCHPSNLSAVTQLKLKHDNDHELMNDFRLVLNINLPRSSEVKESHEEVPYRKGHAVIRGTIQRQVTLESPAQAQHSPVYYLIHPSTQEDLVLESSRNDLLDLSPDSSHYSMADQAFLENISNHSQDSDKSPSISEFGLSIQSIGTRPSTVPTSIPPVPPHTSEIELSTGDEILSPLACIDKSSGQSILKNQQAEENEESDTASIYSNETLTDDPKLHYFQAFVDQLAEDVKIGSEGMILKDLGPDYLDHALREFAWKLHEESSNPFQLETSVIIHRKRRLRDHALREFAWKLHEESFNPFHLESSVIIHRKRRDIVDLLDFEVPQLEHPQLELPQFEISESESEQSSGNSDVEGDGFLAAIPFQKAKETIFAWIGGVNPDPRATTDLSQMPQYRQFIQGSSAYQWLLTKLKQHNRLACEKPNIMDGIGVAIRDKLKTTALLRKMSRNRVPVPIEMTYTVDWDLIGFFRNRGISPPFSAALPDILCLTGTWHEAQATTVIEYMDQTWPQSGRSLITLLQTLLSALEKEDETSVISQHTFSLGNLAVKFNHPSLDITVTGGQYLVSEIGEQTAWLVSALQAPSRDFEGLVESFAHISNLNLYRATRNGKKVANIRASCAFTIDWGQMVGEGVPVRLYWKQLFYFPVLVRGYPILRRSVPKPGLEISLALAASIIGSDQVIQLDDRLLIKGFNMLMIATLVATDLMVWHLLVSEKGGQRISYMDPRLDGIGANTSDSISLHRNPDAKQDIKAAGLPRSPASLRIDKLYIEGGATVIGGFMMDINKKDQPFWLQREKDYPDLLNWVKLRPIVFYDVEERRAWLVDGASALLHLVRISLHLDTTDPESAYDWVYDSSKLKDKWPDVGGRQAAVNTLKNWDNRALGLHIIGKRPDANGVLVPEYSTFEDRVKKILHSIEILIDQQEKAASQDGFRISQTWDPRRDIIGFEVMDLIGPSGPIYPRVQRINSWGHGWTDLVPSIGLTTIFGRGFGDLIRADEPGELCPNWRFVPSGKDFLVASVSTIQMLYEKRLLKLEPGRSEDEIARRVTIVAAKEAANPCNCLKQQGSNSNHLAVTECHHKPVQFLTKRWWLLGALPNGLVPVRLGSLPVRGAVILGHTVLGLSSKDAPTSRQPEDDGSGSTTTGGSLQATGSSSNVTEMTTITTPSVGSSSQQASGGARSGNATGNRTDGTRKKRWSKFKDWVKK
ncbi:hypothetical protein ACHAQI_003800 [Fusarium lateritium]